MILLDTSGLLAALDEDYPSGAAIVELLKAEPRRILSPFVLAELDYLIANRLGASTAHRFVSEIGTGAYELAPFSNSDVAEASSIMHRYADLDLGLADASLVVLSGRYGCHELLTLDERHFRTVLGAAGRPFRILPADA